MEKLGDYVVDTTGSYIKNVTNNLGDGIEKSDFNLPTFNYSFSLNNIEIPDASLHFQFDGMELYVEMNTIISAKATYELNLYTSLSGLKVKGTQLGCVVTVDLILSASGEINISSGFHIKLNDGVAITIPLFRNIVSDMN